MQYVLNDRRTYITTIEFRNTSPILNIERLRLFQEEGLVGNFTKKEFRYSFDNVSWQPWQTLTNSNLMSIGFQDQNNFFIHIKYTRTNVIAGNVNAIYLTYDSKRITPPSPLDSSIIDADYLQGENGEYYLNRENQIGPFTDLEVKNVVSLDTSTYVGTYDHRVDTSDGTTLYFRSLVSDSSSLIIAEDTSGLINFHLDIASVVTDISTSHVFYDTTLDPSIAMVNSVGGIPAGTTVAQLTGDSVTSILNDLLFPTVYPSYVAPSISFTMSPTTTLYEVSTNIATLAFTTSFSRGQILIGSTEQNKRSGVPSSYFFSGLGLVDVSSSSLTNVQSLSGFNVQKGNQTWSSAVLFLVGPQPYDSKGNIWDIPLDAGEIFSTSRTIEGAYPIFATTSSINTLTKQTLVSMSTSIAPSSSGMSLVAESGGKQKFEIPVAWPYTDLTGIQTYNTVSGQWEYQYGSAASSLTAWTVTDSIESIQGYTIPYKRYTYNGTDRSVTSIRLII